MANHGNAVAKTACHLLFEGRDAVRCGRSPAGRRGPSAPSRDARAAEAGLRAGRPASPGRTQAACRRRRQYAVATGERGDDRRWRHFSVRPRRGRSRASASMRRSTGSRTSPPAAPKRPGVSPAGEDASPPGRTLCVCPYGTARCGLGPATGGCRCSAPRASRRLSSQDEARIDPGPW